MYELGKQQKCYKLTVEDLNTHLTNILEGDAKRALSLEEILSRLKFDANQHDPVEKVGQVFQHVERLLEKHGAAGLFPDKKIAKIIVATVQPKELRRRVEYELATVVWRRKLKNTGCGMRFFPMAGYPQSRQDPKVSNQQSKVEVSSTRNKVNQKEKPNSNEARTPISYACDGRDHWSSKCPDKIKDGIRRCHRCNYSAAHMIAGCPKGPKRGADEQVIISDGRQIETTMSKSIRKKNASVTFAESKEKNKTVNVVEEVRGIEKQAIDVMLNGVIETKLAMDTEASSRTCMTRGMLLEFKKQVPSSTQLVE